MNLTPGIASFSSLPDFSTKEVGLSGLPPARSSVSPSGVNYKYRAIKLGPYADELFRLNSDNIVMVHGGPGHGKTVKLLKLAQYFAETGEKVLYINEEEFGRSTLDEKMNLFKIGHPNLTIEGELVDLGPYTIIFFDSINTLNLTSVGVKKLSKQYPNRVFFLIVQSTKDGSFRGGRDWEHLVDIAGEVINRQLILFKNRLDPDNAKKSEALYFEAMVKEKEKQARVNQKVKGMLNQNQ